MRIAIAAQREYFLPHIPPAIAGHQVRYFNTTIRDTHQDYASLIEFDADVNILYRPEFIPTSVLSELRGRKVGMSSEPFPKIIEDKLHYTDDSLGRFKNFLPALDKPFDHIFHYDPSSESFLKKQGIALSGFFPLPVIPAPPASAEGRPIDLFFLGRSTPHRERMIGTLKRDMDLVHVAHGLHGTEVSDFFHRSSIVLNIHAEDEISWEPRVQLALAHWKIVISEPIGPNAILTPGHHFIEVTNQSELVDACREALSNPAQFEKMVTDGFEVTRSKLDAELCYVALLDKIFSGPESPSFHQEKNLLVITPLAVARRYNGMDHLVTKWLNDV